MGKVGSRSDQRVSPETPQESPDVAFDGDLRLARVARGVSRFNGKSPSDALYLISTVDLRSVRSPSLWMRPPGLAIKSMQFSEVGLAVVAAFPSTRGGFSTRKFFISWAAGDHPPAGLFDSPAVLKGSSVVTD